ncbi:hypothetical protein ACN5LN_002816 [Cronobacter malonaticus]
MESLFERISAYNIFNNIIPGAVFCYFFKLFFAVDLGGDSTIYNLCLFYFWGVFVSRVGSLIIEKLAIKTKFVRYSSYTDYLKASRADGDIKMLLEVNNMLRTLSAVFLCLIAVFVLSFAFDRYCIQYIDFPQFSFLGVIISGLLFLTMMFAYKKQTSYIVKRIKSELAQSSISAG